MNFRFEINWIEFVRIVNVIAYKLIESYFILYLFSFHRFDHAVWKMSRVVACNDETNIGAI